MSGAVVGTPGTLPSTWTQNNSTGIVTRVVAFGTDGGIPYIDLQIVGTTATGTANNLFMEVTTQIAALNTQVWTGSLYTKLVAGSLTNISTVVLQVQMLSGAGATLGSFSQTFTPTSSALSSQRIINTATLNNASAAFVRQNLIITSAAAPVAVDLTIRIGAPQLELGAFATSPILTTSAAVTRAAEVATMAFAPSGPSGTLVVQAMMPSSGASASGAFAQIDDGSANNTFALYSASGLVIKALGAASGVTMIDATAGTATALTAFSAGLAFQAGSQIDAMDGAAGTGATGASYPVGLSTLRIGKALSGSAYTNSWIQSVKFWPRALSSAQLLAATR